MFQIQLLILLALGVEVNPTDTPVALVEADVVEALETRARDRLDPVVGHEKVLFPAHENVLALLVVFEGERGRFG